MFAFVLKRNSTVSLLAIVGGASPYGGGGSRAEI